MDPNLWPQRNSRQFLQIIQIFGAAAGGFVASQILESDERDRDALAFRPHATRSALLKGHPIDLIHDFNANGRVAHPNDFPLLQQKFGGQIRCVESKFADGIHDASDVVRRFAHPDVNIAGGPWIAVKSHGEPRSRDTQLRGSSAISRTL
jgi:hypothetical protein